MSRKLTDEEIKKLPKKKYNDIIYGRKRYLRDKEKIKNRNKTYRENHKEQIKKQKKEEYERNKKHYAKQKAEYYQKNKDYFSKKHKKYYELHKNEICDWQHEYHRKNRERLCEQSRIRGEKRRRELKEIVIFHYSNATMKCALCNETDAGVLSIDHINGGGNIERRQLGIIGGGAHFYRHLIKNNFPEGYRVLCPTCQIKEYHKLLRLKRNREEK